MTPLNRNFVLLAVTTAVLSLSAADSNAERSVSNIPSSGAVATAYAADNWQPYLLAGAPSPTPTPDTKPKCPPPLRCPAK